MLEMVDVEYIRKLHFVKGWSIRKIHRKLGHARQTIRKALSSAQIPKYELKSPRSCPVMEPYRDIIGTWLSEDKKAPKKQQHTAKRVYDRLVEEYDFQGSDSTVRKYVEKLHNSQKEVYIPLTSAWGEQAQVDWGRAKAIIGGKETEVCLFCLRMRASKVPFVWAFPTEKLEAFLEGHRRAFEWLGGVPGELVYDNPKTAVVKILSGPKRQEHQVFSSLRAHYLFESIFCRPGKAHEKGAVENLVGYVRRNTFVPMPDVDKLSTLNKHLLAWCEVEKQRHRQDWEQEQTELRPLPSYPFRCSVRKVVKVNKCSLVNYERARYSVPCRYVGETLRVEAYADRIEVWHKNQLVAQHNRSYKRQDTIFELDHYLTALEGKPRAVMHAAVVRRLPEAYARAKSLLCEARGDGYRDFCQILLLHREFPPQEVKLAIESALEMGALSPATVRQILINRSAFPTPPPVEIKGELVNHKIPQAGINCYDKLLEVSV